VLAPQGLGLHSSAAIGKVMRNLMKATFLTRIFNVDDLIKQVRRKSEKKFLGAVFATMESYFSTCKKDLQN
jgi:galactokinase